MHITTHVVCEGDTLTLRFAKTLGGGEKLQVEHRGEGGAQALRRMLLYHHHLHIFLNVESEVILCMFYVRCANQMYKFLKRSTNALS